MRTVTVTALAVLALAFAASQAAGLVQSFTNTSSTVALLSAAPNVKTHLLFAGMVVSDNDYTQVPVTFDSPGGVQHVSGWRTYTAAQLGVPAKAHAVILGVKMVVTKGDADSDAVVYLHARAHGAGVCVGGDPAHEQYAIDGNYGNPVECMIGQAAAHLANDTVRQITTEIVPLRNGALDLSWGFRRVDGAWPAADGVAVAVYVNGYLG